MKAIAFLFLAALALVCGLWLWRQQPAIDDAAPVLITVAGAPLRVDPLMARVRADLANPALDVLDLALAMPDLSPAGARANALPLESLVFLTLRRRDEKIDPRDKPARLYARFLEPLVEAHPAGLIRRGFQPGSPYDREILYMTPPEGRDFWARCASATQTLPANCISETRIGGLDVSARFTPELLGDWERVTAGVVRLVEGMAR